jgi:tellurite resistance protein
MPDTAYRRRYGHPPPKAAQLGLYFRALKLLAGADGLAPEEAAALHELMHALGAPDQVIREVAEFDHETATLTDHLPVSGDRSYARMLLYDAIHLAWADGEYSATERDAIAAAARRLHVAMPLLHALEGVVELERLAARMRADLFDE